MPTHFADRLSDAVRARATPAVVALDPVVEHLPAELRGDHPVDGPAAVSALGEFCTTAIDLIAPVVPAVKLNIACFERHGPAGLAVYLAAAAHAARRGLLVIGDVKRGDVGHTAELYARAHLPAVDAITVSGYLGADGVEPFLELAAPEGRGVFVLVRTSNPSAGSIQDLVLQDGRKLHEALAARVADWAARPGRLGATGWSCVGAVVATRDAADAARLRAAMPRSIFLVPGYGAQGGMAEDFRPCFRPDGGGALIAAGRSVIFAHESDDIRRQAGPRWEDCLVHACRAFAADVARLLPGGGV
jgi:orotidine-5'-phosphate decarboxylase